MFDELLNGSNKNTHAMDTFVSIKDIFCIEPPYFNMLFDRVDNTLTSKYSDFLHIFK